MNRTLLFPLLVTALVPAACGSSDEAAAPPVKPVTHAEFVTQGNQVCERLVADIGELSGRLMGEGEPTPEKASKFAAAAVPVTERGVQQIAALPAPAADRPKIDAMVAEYQKGIDAFRAAGESPEVAEELLQAEDPFVKANTSARKLGLTACDS
jgi:hypothetical protein